MRQPTVSVRGDISAASLRLAGRPPPIQAVGPRREIRPVAMGMVALDCPLEEDWGDWNTVEFFETATVDVVLECLADGADPNARDRDGWTPLHFAAAANTDHAVVAALVEAGADVQARGRGGRTPLHLAAANINTAAVRTLIEAGADPMARNRGGSTPLHMAAFRNCDGDPGAIIELLGAGADPRARSAGGWTPLHWAALYNTAVAVDALLHAGADPDARAAWQTFPDRVTPRDLARNNACLKGTEAYRRLSGRKRWTSWLCGLGLVKFRSA